MASSKGHPLDLILGTQAAVRVLRVLSPGGEHAPPRIARDTKVSRPAVREALIRLEKEGVVERVGDGRNVLYRISSDHPLAKRIVKLFKTEAKRGAIAGLLLLCASSLHAQAVTNAPADLIVTGGHIYTVDDTRPAAQAFAVRNGVFTFVGSASEAMALKGSNTRVIDLHGQTVVPGLADAHGHLSGLGAFLHEENLVGSLSYDEVIARVVQHAGKPARGQWILGGGWDQNRWASNQFPTSDALTRAFPDNPVVLDRVDGHAVLANAAAMQAAGVTAATMDPAGGRILRDARGNPTGVFIDNAQELIQHAVPPESAAQLESELRDAIVYCNRYGLVSVHDPGEPRAVIDVMESMARKNEFGLRGYILIADDSAAIAHYYTIGPRSELYGGHLWVRAIKLYADGALGSRGAALLSPYSDDPGNTGLLVSTEPHLQAVATSALRHGFQVATHAIGDRGNRNALDAYEAALTTVPTADHRFRIEHAQILDPADIPRFAELGVIPSMQASHQTSDMRWAEDRLGPSRIRGAYAWRSLLNTGVIIPNGTDFPVEQVNPLITFHSAVTRQDSTGWPDGGWYPEQRMTRGEALKSMTIWAAYAGFEEHVMGSITPGKYADFTVLDQDIMTVPDNDILKTNVVATYIGGKSVYERR